MTVLAESFLAAMLLVGVAKASTTGAVRVAITLDDLPFLDGVGPKDTPAAATDRILSALKTNGAHATGFVSCHTKAVDTTVLKKWQAAGLPLGNHSTQHRPIDSMTPQEWRDDLLDCNEQLTGLLGAPPAFYRFPMLQAGATAERRDAAAAELARLDLRTAPVSIDTSDWLLNRAYVRSLRAHDSATASAIGAAYVTHVREALAHYRTVAARRVGREIRHVLLLHHHALAADHLGTLLLALSRDGAVFIRLEEALADPVYAQRDDYAGGIGMSWLYHLAPADESAWAWDNGQIRALATRFDIAEEGLRRDRTNRIDVDLTARILTPHALVITDTKPWPANSLVVEMSDGSLVIVGTPYTPEKTARLLTWLRARFGDRPRVAVNPHFHSDSAGGNEALRAAGIPIYGSARTAALLDERRSGVRPREREALKEDQGAASGFAFVPPPPDHLFDPDNGTSLRFGSDSMQLAFLGAGHSPDGIVAFFPRERVLFGGCLVLAGDMVGNTADADVAAWPATIARLRQFDAAHVVPGHGDRFSLDLIDHTLAVLEAEAKRGRTR